jgi:conjugal transfer pilus assembly protein TrbC
MMKLIMLIFALFTLGSSLAFAEDDYYSMAMDVKNNIPKQTALYKNDVKQIVLAGSQHSAIYRDEIKNIESKNNIQTQREIIKNPTTSILIFVSFSMPRQSLEAYLRDARTIGASVIIRGLIDNSFQKTFQAMTELVNASGGQGVELNPIWFKRFNIHNVPAVVVIPAGSNCFQNDQCYADKNYDVMTGEITLSAALKQLRDRGVAKEVAQTAIDKLEGRYHA